MTKINMKTKESMKPDAAQMIGQVEKKFGFVPNLMSVFANSPAALQAYLTLSELAAKTTLSPVEQQAVLLTVSRENNCAYCMAAHSMMADKMAGMPADHLQSIREGREISDKKLNELVRFAREIVNERGRPSSESIERFYKAGYNAENVLEILLCTAMKTLSNYANHIAETPVDQAFSQYSWKK